MKNQNSVLIWGGFLLATIIVSILIFIFMILVGVSDSLLWAIPIAFFCATWGVTIIKGLFETPHKHQDIVESLGRYIGKPLKAGPHLFFPWFNMEKIRARVFMGEQKLELYLDEKSSDSGDVEFQDCSASLKAFFFFEITDAEKATYDIGNVLKSVSEKAEHILRAFFGVYTLDEAIALKGFFRLENVISLIDKSKDSSERLKLTPEEFKQMNAGFAEVKDTSFYETLSNWGVNPKSFIISDIDIPKEIKEQRARVLIAEKDREIAVIAIETARQNKKTLIINAEASAKKAAIEGQGEAQRIKNLADGGLDSQSAIDYLVAKEKWGAVKSNPNTTLIIGDSEANKGAQIGAGIGATTKEKIKKGGK